MGNEMGNNNTSEFREEEQARTEGPEQSLLEGGANEVKADEVADFSQKEARPGSDGADKLNENHHVIEKEEEKNKECNTAEFHVVSEKLPDRTKEDNEVQANSKEDKTKEFDSEENRSDGNEHEHEKQASNQEEEEGEGVSNLNTTILALDEPKPEKTSDFKSTQHELLNIKAESFIEDSNKSPEECKDALGLSSNDTYHSADCAMADSEETTNMDRVLGIGRGIDKENGVRGKGSNFDMITQASEDPKTKKISDFDADQVIDTDRDADKEDDRERGKGSNLDPKTEKTTDFHVDQVLDTDRDTEKEGDIERLKGSNCNTMTQASEDPKSENFSDFVAEQVIDNDQEKGDIGMVKGSHCNTMTQASEDPKSENFSDFVADQVIDNDQEKHNENDGARGKDSNFDTRKQASEDPKSETTSNFDADQVIETNQDTDKEGDGLKEKVSNFDMIAQALKDPKLRKPSDFDADQVIDTLRDTDKENDAEKGKSYDVKTLHVQDDPKSENNSDLKSIHHELPETKAESLGGSSDDGSVQESKYCSGSSLEHTEENGHVMFTEKLTDVDCFGAEAETDMEKKKCDIIEPRACHEYTMPAAKIVDTKDEEIAIDLIGHNTSCSQPEESMVIELPKSCMQVPEFENRCTVLKENPQLREEQGTETIVQDNPPTQSKISNEVQEEFNTIRSHSEENAASESVVRNQNETPGEDCEDSDGEYLEISEQVMEVLNSSIGDCKQKNGGMGETTEISTNIGHEGERREPKENLFEPLLGLQPQSHQKEASITFQTGESTDESISTLRQITEKATEKSKKNSSDSPHYIQTASATFTETKPSTNPIDEQNVTTLPLSTFTEENQESPGRTSNESNSDNSVGHIEMRKSPSFNIDIQSEGKTVETEKIPLLYQIKTIEDLQNLQEISFPNPTEKRVVKLGRSESEKSRPSFPGFAKEKEKSEMESTAINQHKLGATKNAVKDLPPPSPIRKGKRRSKSLIFGTCICCATAIN
ncbi:uncharacterized protein LOC111474732 [Cucurbita maxima]|uniref:Uncharacterized protein LOC111474732 n=1 Tax=Cucurbita maxima TaxID=3661 RepID=A0A6J1IJ54_CUCMA|nr:uncharacterized protein LOC111474732 [Cucurbita maxima]XP_022975418.1 uncharacterized protein LOC111474732 [Cucurbita maxima]XP_022975419.1 uncharacterized protein LOC111474732 [Cucurbita maxima]